MISLEDKIDIFEQELSEQLSTFRKEKLAQEDREKILKEEEADRRIKEETKAIIERYKRLENRNVSKILSDGNSEAREILTSTLRDLRADFMESLLKAVRQILGNPNYTVYIRNALKEIGTMLKDSVAITIFINEDERELFKNDIESILKDFRITYYDLPENKIGGFIVHDQDDRVSYDFSLENLVNEADLAINSVFRELIYGEE